MKQELRNYIETNLPQAIARCENLMNINSHSHNIPGVNLVQDEFEAWLKELGFSVERYRNRKTADHLFASSPQAAAQPKSGILLVGHADTAHAADSKFQTTRREGDKVIGPGGYDMKAGVVSFLFGLEALRSLSPELQIPVHILIIGDEEIGMQDSYDLHRMAAGRSSSALVFESGRPRNMVILTRKGIAIAEVRSAGKKAHSGNEFWMGKNAILPLCEVAQRIASLSDKAKNVTLNVGAIQGGTSPTVVPDEGSLRFDIRYPTQAVYEETWKQLENTITELNSQGYALSLERKLFVPPMEPMKEGKDLADSYMKVCEQLDMEFCLNEDLIGGSSSASILAACGLPTIDALGPAGEGAHTDEEWFSVESFARKTEAFALWMSLQK